MIPTTVDKIYLVNIFMIERLDVIAEGVDGADSKGNFQIGECTAYVKRFSSEWIKGNGSPSGNYGIFVNSDTLNNTFYLDETSQSIWVPKTIQGNSIIEWENNSKNFILNIKGLKLNDGVNELEFNELLYEVPETGVSGVILYNKNGDLAGLRVRKIICEKAISLLSNQIQIDDDEVISNDFSKKQSDNDDGGFAVGNVNLSNVRNDKHFFYNSENQYWECYDDNGLLDFNVSQLVINNIPFDTSISSEQEILINNQTQFDTYFNTTSPGGITTFLNAGPYSSFYIKSGNYILTNFLVIQKSNFRIQCEEGAKIRVDLPQQVTYEYNKKLWSWSGYNFTYDYFESLFSFCFYNTQLPTANYIIFTNGARDVELNLNLDCHNIKMVSMIHFVNSWNFKSHIKLYNAKVGNVFSSDSTPYNSILSVYMDNIMPFKPTNVFHNISNTYLSGMVTTPYNNIFDNCSNYAFNGFLDGYSTLITSN